MDESAEIARLALALDRRPTKGPRPSTSYRWFRRNEVKRTGKLDMWRANTTRHANLVAKLPERAALCNDARIAAARAMQTTEQGVRREVVVAKAVLAVYRHSKLWGRAVSRCARQVEKVAFA